MRITPNLPHLCRLSEDGAEAVAKRRRLPHSLGDSVLISTLQEILMVYHRKLSALETLICEIERIETSSSKWQTCISIHTKDKAKISRIFWNDIYPGSYDYPRILQIVG